MGGCVFKVLRDAARLFAWLLGVASLLTEIGETLSEVINDHVEINWILV